jgi:heme exporter protein A
MLFGMGEDLITALDVDGLALSRGERRLFAGFALRVQAGEAVAVTGANGAGKTSLLRAVAGLLRPDEGAIRFIGAKGQLDTGEARRQGLHLLGHQDGLKLGRRVREELAFQANWSGGGAGGMAQAIEALELAPLLDLEVRMLSAGQRRRVALARLVASPKSLWLLDEPLAPLDTARRAGLGELMRAHLNDGGMILAAVHDPLPLPAREEPLP